MEKHSNEINTLWWNKEKGSRLTASQSQFVSYVKIELLNIFKQ